MVYLNEGEIWWAVGLIKNRMATWSKLTWVGSKLRPNGGQTTKLNHCRVHQRGQRDELKLHED